MKPIQTFIRYAILLVTGVGPTYCHAVENLCLESEKTYFSCKIKNKVLSLCLSNTSSKLQYRFGQSGERLELVFPKEDKKNKSSFYSFYEGGAKGGMQAIGFTIGQYTYAVFETRSAFGYNGAGVAISKDEKIEALLSCNRGSLDSENFFGKAEELGLPEKILIFPTTEYVESK